MNDKKQNNTDSMSERNSIVSREAFIAFAKLLARQSANDNHRARQTDTDIESGAER